MSSEPKRKGIAIGVAIGAVIGVVTGVLFAPKSGKETREDIKNTTLRAAHKVHDESENLLEQAKDFSGKVEEKAKKSVDDVRRTAESLKTAAVSFKEGKAEDKDLDKAVKKAIEAQASLKKFLKK